MSINGAVRVNPVFSEDNRVHIDISICTHLGLLSEKQSRWRAIGVLAETNRLSYWRRGNEQRSALIRDCFYSTLYISAFYFYDAPLLFLIE